MRDQRDHHASRITHHPSMTSFNQIQTRRLRLNHSIRLTIPKITRRLELIAPLVYRRRHTLAPFRYRTLPDWQTMPVFDTAPDDPAWQAIPFHSYWGGQDVHFVMAGEFTIPSDFDPHSPVALFLPLGEAGEFSHPEALLYVNGRPLAACDRHHQEILLDESLGLRGAPANGRSHHLLLHGWTGYMGGAATEPGRQLFMRPCAVVQIDQPTRDFVAAARAALQTATLLDPYDPTQARLLNALDDAITCLDTREPFGAPFYASVPGALDTLRHGIAHAGPPLAADIIAAGHAHIDVAWLWTLGQTRRKAGRTFHTVLHLMQQFPDYHFTQSQPQLYEFVRQDYPDLFAAIQQRVADGRWEAIGGMWVEADCNITGPESLARQFLLGRAYFRQHFGAGAESPVLWLPDVFGYTWSLPQLIKQAGLEYFFTIKIGWNQVNKMPYDSFWWQGLDGTRVLTHFSTTPDQPTVAPKREELDGFATYNANLTPFAALGSWAKLKHKESQRVMLMSYGYGDGGGGPTREMNEAAQLLADFPGVPRVKQGRVIDFFRRLDAESGAQLPTWNNELYLEIHRGTYTTQARIKRANRKNEFLLHDAEFLASLARLINPDYAYPHAALNDAWQLLCLNQFHDIIPGSSIGAVYVEAAQQHAQIAELATAVTQSALAALTPHTGGDVVVINATGFRRDDLAFWPGQLPGGQHFAADDGSPIGAQPVEGGTLLAVGEMPPLGVRPLWLTEGDGLMGENGRFPLTVTPTLLENIYLRVEFNAAGDIVRLYDKANQRDVLPPDAIANQFQAFEDRPLNWDAWDIDIFYEDKRFLAEPASTVAVVENGPLRATLEIRRQILNSPYIQRISLAFNSPTLDFDTTMDWRERHVLLKTAFPVDVLAHAATHEIQWGSVQRPTHRNSSWDWARFETAAQKWVDVSEGSYGVALLNDCKYGHDIRGNVMRLSLLRAPTQPDPEADQGTHRFAYRLFPHANAAGAALTPSDVAARAYAFNDPLLVGRGVSAEGAEKRMGGRLESLVTLPPNLVLETVKVAEDGRGLIVRFYEANRQRGVAELVAGFAVAEAYRCNLLEEEPSPLAVAGRRVELAIRPFEIVTLRLLPEGW
jgi:alpha-mannosidase